VIITVGSPGFSARRGTRQSYWVFTGGNYRHIVTVRLCTGQSTLKKCNCCKSRGARRQRSNFINSCVFNFAILFKSWKFGCETQRVLQYLFGKRTLRDEIRDSHRLEISHWSLHPPSDSWGRSIAPFMSQLAYIGSGLFVTLIFIIHCMQHSGKSVSVDMWNQNSFPQWNCVALEIFLLLVYWAWVICLLIFCAKIVI